MVIALYSDIHANYEALAACLAHANDHGADQHVFLGDLVGYGADSQAVLDAVAQRAAEGAIVIKGNHDEAIERHPRYMNESAQASIEHARATLTDSHKKLLASLPLIVREGRMCYVHASAAQPQRWDYVDSPSAAVKSVNAALTQYTFSGHVHDQTLYYERAGVMTVFRPTPGTAIPVPRHRRYHVIVGSVGQPRDRNPAAAYALFDVEHERLTFHRVAYNHFAAAKRIRDAGLPEGLAYRVERGI